MPFNKTLPLKKNCSTSTKMFAYATKISIKFRLVLILNPSLLPLSSTIDSRDVTEFHWSSKRIEFWDTVSLARFRTSDSWQGIALSGFYTNQSFEQVLSSARSPVVIAESITQFPNILSQV